MLSPNTESQLKAAAAPWQPPPEAFEPVAIQASAVQAPAPLHPDVIRELRKIVRAGGTLS